MEWDSGIVRGLNSKGLGGQTVSSEAHCESFLTSG